MKKSDLMVEDITKRIYKTEKEEYCLLEFADTYTEKGKKAKKLKKRAVVNNTITETLFDFLESYHVPNYYVKRINETSAQVRSFQPIPLLVKVRNVAAKDLAKRFPIKAGSLLAYPVIELYYKSAKLKNPFINEYHAYVLNCVTPDEMRMMNRMTSKINAVLKSFFLRRELGLIDFIIEFGRQKSKIVLTGDLSLDAFRLFDNETEDEYYGPDILEQERSPDQVYEDVCNYICD